MTWIDDRLAERKASRERWGLIKQHADAVYEALWKQIVEYVTEAKSKSISVFTNGSVHHRIVSLSWPIKPATKDPDHLHVTMTRTSIHARGEKVDLEFRFGAYPDGVVGLTLDGEPISTEATARRILDPFLFPELQP